MYAIIEAGGKQYKVSEGDVIKVDYAIDAGQDVKINKVLAAITESKTIVGQPYIENAEVTADVLESGKSRKVLIFKQRPRKGFRRLKGHRQAYSKLRIKEIKAGG